MQWRDFCSFPKSGKIPEEMLRLKIADEGGKIYEAGVFRK